MQRYTIFRETSNTHIITVANDTKKSAAVVSQRIYLFCVNIKALKTKSRRLKHRQLRRPTRRHPSSRRHRSSRRCPHPGRRRP